MKILGLLFSILLLVGCDTQTTVVVTPTPVPYQSKIYSTLRLDVLQLCTYDNQNDRNPKLFDKWLEKYNSDRIKLQNEGIYAPDYGTMSHVVGPPC